MLNYVKLNYYIKLCKTQTLNLLDNKKSLNCIKYQNIQNINYSILICKFKSVKQKNLNLKSNPMNLTIKDITC